MGNFNSQARRTPFRTKQSAALHPITLHIIGYSKRSKAHMSVYTYYRYNTHTSGVKSKC